MSKSYRRMNTCTSVAEKVKNFWRQTSNSTSPGTLTTEKMIFPKVPRTTVKHPQKMKATTSFSPKKEPLDLEFFKTQKVVLWQEKARVPREGIGSADYNNR